MWVKKTQERLNHGKHRRGFLFFPSVFFICPVNECLSLNFLWFIQSGFFLLSAFFSTFLLKAGDMTGSSIFDSMCHEVEQKSMSCIFHSYLGFYSTQDACLEITTPTTSTIMMAAYFCTSLWCSKSFHYNFPPSSVHPFAFILSFTLKESTHFTSQVFEYLKN